MQREKVSGARRAIRIAWKALASLRPASPHFDSLERKKWFGIRKFSKWESSLETTTFYLEYFLRAVISNSFAGDIKAFFGSFRCRKNFRSELLVLFSLLFAPSLSLSSGWWKDLQVRLREGELSAFHFSSDDRYTGNWITLSQSGTARAKNIFIEKKSEKAKKRKSCTFCKYERASTNSLTSYTNSKTFESLSIIAVTFET